MREAIGDFWKMPCDARLITTNCVLRRDQTLVMGAGIAKFAAMKWPWLPMAAGSHVLANGSTPVAFADAGVGTFPTKYHWRDNADINLIESSALFWQRLLCSNDTSLAHWQTILLTRPGCGLGHLAWNYVKPVIAQYLDERFIVVDSKL